MARTGEASSSAAAILVRLGISTFLVSFLEMSDDANTAERNAYVNR